MADWDELSRDSWRAAQELRDKGRLRSSVSRAYFAAYCGATHALSKKHLRYPKGRNNPPHEAVDTLVENYLSEYPRNTRRRVGNALRILRNARETADYRPGHTVDLELTINWFHHAALVIKAFGIFGMKER